VDNPDKVNTQSEIAVYADLDKQVDPHLLHFREVLSKDLPALNEAMRKANVPSVAPAATKTE
jgi:hypothetical protein